MEQNYLQLATAYENLAAAYRSMAKAGKATPAETATPESPAAPMEAPAVTIKDIERDEKTLHIEYPSDYMDLCMNEFFPCTVEKARKVFRLMRAYSPDSYKEKLLRHLNRQVQSFTDQMKSCAELAASTEAKSERSKFTAEFKQAQMKKRRAKRNIKMLWEVM